MNAARGRVAVIGCGPAGMAAALSLHQAGHDVSLLERYREARPAGNILNLWPPPIKALGSDGRRHRRPRRAVPVRVPQRLRQGARRRTATAGRDRRLRRRLHRAAAPRAVRAAPRCTPARGTPASNEEVTSFDQDERAVHPDIRRRPHRGVRRARRRRRHRLPGPAHAVGRRPQARAQPAHLRWLHLRRHPRRRARPLHRLPQPDHPGQLDRHPQQGPQRLPMVGADRPRRRPDFAGDYHQTATALAADVRRTRCRAGRRHRSRPTSSDG